jgi:DNA-directed RNA polymerase subunit RPC12/RpoP
MQMFLCPQCGHKSEYDPWKGSARCPKCGYEPAEGAPIRGRVPLKRDTYQPFLDELLAHWDNTATPDPSFRLPTTGFALEFFKVYQRALGEDPMLHAGYSPTGFVRNYHPEQPEVLRFVGGYMLLKQGDRAAAAKKFRALSEAYPEFADPWVWLTAVTTDPDERLDYLENAVLAEPAHPLARDALAIARGRVSLKSAPAGKPDEQATTPTKCPKCGGALRHEPGAREVTCPHCGHAIGFKEEDLLEKDARLIGDLRLERRYRGHTWAEVRRLVRCQACGAEVTMTHRLAKQCAFCGSTHVLVQDARRTFEQPDGILPFRVREKQAETAIQDALRSGLRGLKTRLTGERHRAVDVRGLYLPFWVFDSFVEVRTWRTEGRFRPRPRMGGAPVGDMLMFDNLLFSAMEKPPPEFLRKMFPFEMKGLARYKPELLAGWSAALYQRDVELVVQEADELIMQLAQWKMGPLIAAGPQPGGGRLKRTFQVTSTTYQLVLLPVWIALLQSEDKRRLALVNGQTGKVAFGRSTRLGSQEARIP